MLVHIKKRYFRHFLLLLKIIESLQCVLNTISQYENTHKHTYKFAQMNK